MIQITPHMRIFVAFEAPDFRCGVRRLAAICSEELNQDPYSGALFLFRNRKSTSIKIIAYDGQGFWICQKILSTGRFRFWPKSHAESTPALAAMAAHELQVLLWNGDPASTAVAELWRPIPLPQSSRPATFC